MIELTETEQKAQEAGIVLDLDKLSQPSDIIRQIEDTELFELVDRMKKIMLSNNGVGLAAPQIGKHIQMFIFLDGEKIETVMNPEIISKYEQVDCTEEGCLSLPGMFRAVCRPKKITVKYMTIKNNQIEEIERELKDLPAKIFQHEVDHLSGKLCIEI